MTVVRLREFGVLVVLSLLAGLVWLAVPAAAEEGAPVCSIVGSEGDDVLVGTVQGSHLASRVPAVRFVELSQAVHGSERLESRLCQGHR